MAVAPLCVLPLLLAGGVPAAAQGWRLEADVGQLRFEAAPGNIPSSTLVVGGAYDDLAGWLRLSAGVPLSAQDPVWGAAGAGRRLAAAAGPFRLGVDLAGNGFVQRDRTSSSAQPSGGGLLGGLDPTATPPAPGSSGFGLAGQGGGFLGARAGPARLELRGGVSAYRADVGGLTRDRTVPLAEARAVLAPAPALALAGSARRYFAPDGAATLAEATATAAGSAGSVWASAGSWLAAPSGAVKGVPWGAGATLRLGGPAELALEARHDAYDPLYLSVPRTSWSVGLHWRLGPAPRGPAPAPVPRAYDGRSAVIALAAKDARGAGAPRVAGDFNGWTPQPMRRAGDEWRIAVPAVPGVYYYAFVAPDGHWYVPPSVAGRRDDGMGGEVAVLVVR